MITKFNTTSGAQTAPSGSGSNTLLYIVIAAVGLYLGYKYIYIPEMEKRKAAQQS